MSPPETVLNEPAVAMPAGTANAIGAPRTILGIRTWMVTLLLFSLPLLAYWPTTFHDFGLRDDYSNLREAHEEIGKVLRFCASHARPIYGWMLQATYGQTNSVQNLQWMRFIGALLLGALSLVSFRALRALGWRSGPSLCFALMLALVPSSQVIASWAVGWPYAATALLAVCGFFAAEGALRMGLRDSLARAAGRWMLALSVMVVTALIYQPSSMFYIVPLAAALLAQRHRTLPQTVRWVAIHMGFVGLALGFAYLTMSALYAAGVFVKSGRIAFEHHWIEKMAWFLGEALPNGLSMFVLNDNNQHGHSLYMGGAALAGLILIAGVYLEWRRYGRRRGMIWLGALMVLPTFACGVSLIASEHYATYRTILAMTAVLLCFLVASVAAMTEYWSTSARRLLAALAVALAFLTAQHHAYALIAVPQGNEWQLIMAGAKHVRLDGPRQRIYAVASSPADISTATIYHDEFGSLSSNSEWVPREMFKRAMHDLHPEIQNLDARYDFATGPRVPEGQKFDVIIDMHRLRQFYTDN
jgi:hypothetical protein